MAWELQIKSSASKKNKKMIYVSIFNFLHVNNSWSLKKTQPSLLTSKLKFLSPLSLSSLTSAQTEESETEEKKKKPLLHQTIAQIVE